MTAVKPPHRVGFLCRFGLKTGMVFEGTTGAYERIFVSIPNDKERKRNMRTRNIFEDLFCLRSNLSNDDIISAQGPGLKTGNENGFWKMTFFGLK